MDVPSASIILCTWHISSFVTYCPTVKHPRIQVDPTRFTSWYMFILMQKGIKVWYDMIPIKLILKKIWTLKILGFYFYPYSFLWKLFINISWNIKWYSVKVMLIINAGISVPTKHHQRHLGTKSTLNINLHIEWALIWFHRIGIFLCLLPLETVK